MKTKLLRARDTTQNQLSGSAEYVHQSCTNKDHITAKAVHIKRESVRCVERKYWRQKAIVKAVLRHLIPCPQFDQLV